MTEKSSTLKKTNEFKLPKSVLNPLCDWLLDNFKDGETVLFRIVASNSENMVSFNVHVEVDFIQKIEKS